MKHSLIKTIFFLFLIIPLKSFAHKVDLHIWIGQQIINDLEDDGQLTYVIDGKTKSIKVEANIIQAILANKAYFLQGNVGPDALPGIFSGQMTIHPGNENDGWGTGEWLEHMLKNAKTPKEIAFVYGYFCHAASDVFAHTYVNHYSGDCFSLLDGETSVEKRHFLLEGYISTFLPPMLDFKGNDLGSPASNTLINGQSAVPTDFLWRIFLNDNSAINEFSINGSTHFALISNLYNSLGVIIKDGGLAEDLHIEIQKIVIIELAGINVNKKQLEEINRVRQDVHNFTNNTIDEAQKIESKVKTELINIFHNDNQRVLDGLSEINKLLDEIISLQKKKHNIEKSIVDLDKQIQNLPLTILETVDKYIKNPDPVARLVTKWIKDGTEQVSKANPDIAIKKKLLNEKHKLENSLASDLTNKFSQFRQTVEKVFKTSEEILKTENEISQASLDFLQRFDKDENPIAGLVTEWQEDIEKAMKEYFMANATAINNSISSKDVLDPLLNWKSCWLPAILGIPSEISNGVCSTKSLHDSIKETLSKIEDLAIELDPVAKEVKRIRTEIEESLKEALTKELFDFTEKTFGIDIQELISLIKEKPNANRINSVFSESPSSKSLIIINDVSNRVNNDIQISNGIFDVNNFNAVYNSIVLSKLALLNHNGLNKLIRRKVYIGKSLATDNIMIRFPKSIDGNHQWLKEAPPYIRENEIYDTSEAFGYEKGFLLWENKRARKKVFRKLFKGPINPSLELPNNFNFEDIIPKSYPYKPNKNCQFPNYPESHKCK